MTDLSEHHPVRFGMNTSVPPGLIVAVLPDRTIHVYTADGGGMNFPQGTVCWMGPVVYHGMVEALREMGQLRQVQ